MWHVLLSASALPLLAGAQTLSSCTSLQPSGSVRPSVASGYHLQVVATGLSRPRGLAIDSQGHLLVVEAGAGRISAHTVNDNAGCVTLGDSVTVASGLSLNHGIQISEDGNTLYASNVDRVFSWSYDAAARSTSNQVTLITGMNGTDHTTRTLELSKQVPGMLVVSRGSFENLDYEAANVESGHAQVKVFDLNARGDREYNWTADGTRLGWGLRNSVGVAEHPVTGGIWSVENSADNIRRDGQQVNQNNPAEELNFHGYLNGTVYAQQGGNYGYPWCFSAWAPNELPDSEDITVGEQFALSQNSDLNNENQTDTYCSEQVPPRLSFQAHMAPLDIKFNQTGDQAWISFHGSWNREQPTGYKVSIVQFQNGEPTEPSTSTSALIDIVKNEDDSACPGDCLRPATLAIDSQQRVYFSSDATGEIYLITRDATAPGPAATTSNPASPSQTPSSSTSLHVSLCWIYGIVGVLMGAIIGF